MTQTIRRIIPLIIFVTALMTSVLSASAVTEFPICTQGNDQYDPAIYGNIVVWYDSRNGNEDIYGYNLSTSTEFPICTQGNDQYDPAIYGNIVVWYDSRNGNYDIYGYNLSTSTEFPICTQGNNQGYPAIYGNTVMWRDSRNGNGDIYGYNLSTSTEFPICTQGSGQGGPAIYGNIVVWFDSRNGNYDIYGARLPAASHALQHPVDYNSPLRSLASYRISQTQSLFEEVQETCEKPKEEGDPLHDTCCVDRLDEVKEYLGTAEKFFMGGNYIAANYWAVKALGVLHEIEECCSP
jgi:beta propeller repeat protein